MHIGGDQGVKESPLKSAKHLIAKPVLDGLNHVYQWGALQRRWSFCALQRSACSKFLAIVDSDRGLAEQKQIC